MGSDLEQDMDISAFVRHSFPHSSHKYLMRAFGVSGPVLGPTDLAVVKIIFLSLWSLCSKREGQITNKQNKEINGI